MKPFIIAAVAAAIIAPAAQAHAFRPTPGAYEQIANRCMFIAATSTPTHAPETDITRAAMLCVNGAEHAITHTEVSEAYQREALAADVEQATDQTTASHAQLFLDAYDAGALIGRGYTEPNGDDEEIYDPNGSY